MPTTKRQPVIAGNWKLNLTVDEGVALVERMKPQLELVTTIEQIICPPFITLAPLQRLLSNSPIQLGAQDVFWEDQGAFTGEISPLMLAPLCRYVIVGHSERRQYFGVTDEQVNRKIKACLAHGLQPILCVGEGLADYEADRTATIIEGQLRGGLHGLTSCPGLSVAYEPIWAIGTGKPATGAGANQVIGGIRQVLGSLLTDDAEAIRLMYGGSVSSGNITEFLGQEEIDGALVGGASIRSHDFVAIVQTAAATR